MRAEDFTIYGIEIDKGAADVTTHPFSGNCSKTNMFLTYSGNSAFILGNEGDGLSAPESEFCDKLIYIPQCGT